MTSLRVDLHIADILREIADQVETLHGEPETKGEVNIEAGREILHHGKYCTYGDKTYEIDGFLGDKPVTYNLLIIEK